MDLLALGTYALLGVFAGLMAGMLGMSAETLRVWQRRLEVDAGE